MAAVFMLHWFLMINFQYILGHVFFFFYIRLPMICFRSSARLRVRLNELNIAYRKSLARLPILPFVLYSCSQHPQRNRLSPEHSPQCPTAGKILDLIVFLTMSYAQTIQYNLTCIINKHVGFIWSRRSLTPRKKKSVMQIRFLFVLRAKHCAVWSMNTTYWTHEYSDNKLTWQSCSREKEKILLCIYFHLFSRVVSYAQIHGVTDEQIWLQCNTKKNNAYSQVFFKLSNNFRVYLHWLCHWGV